MPGVCHRGKQCVSVVIVPLSERVSEAVWVYLEITFPQPRNPWSTAASQESPKVRQSHPSHSLCVSPGKEWQKNLAQL